MKSTLRLLPFALVWFVALSVGLSARAAEVRASVGWAELLAKNEGWEVQAVREFGRGNLSLSLRPGDLILEVDGQDVSGIGPISITSLLSDALYRSRPLVVRRQGQKQEVLLRLSEDASSQTNVSERYGIGVTIGPRPNSPGVWINKVLPGGPAERAGIKEGDELIAVSGQEVTHVPMARVAELVVAPQPTPVRLRIRRGVDEFEFEVQRASVRELFKPPEPSLSRFPLHKRGEPAPSFTLPDSQGKKVSLNEFRGRWVLLDFWATWCVPCQFEIPVLNKLATDFRDKLVVLSLDVDDKPEALQRFLTQTSLSYKVLIAGKMEDPLPRAYNLRGLPTSVLIDPRGLPTYVELGVLPQSRLESHLRSLLGKPKEETHPSTR